MRRMQRIVLLATLVAIAPVIAGCADFDPDKLDIFGLSDKKKLPGDRKPLFPEGVPGVTQGVPPEYLKGNQPPPDAALAAPVTPVNGAPAGDAEKQSAAAAPAEQPAAKPKPQPKAAAKPKPKPKRVVKRTPQPPAAAAAAPAQSAAQQPPSVWPAPGQSTSTAPSSAPSSAPWPSAPPAGTFTR